MLCQRISTRRRGADPQRGGGSGAAVECVE